MSETLLQTIRKFSLGIGREFGIEKFAMLLMKSGKRETMEGIELPNIIRTLEEKEDYEYLGILEADALKQGIRKLMKMH